MLTNLRHLGSRAQISLSIFWRLGVKIKTKIKENKGLTVGFVLRNTSIGKNGRMEGLENECATSSL